MSTTLNKICLTFDAMEEVYSTFDAMVKYTSHSAVGVQKLDVPKNRTYSKSGRKFAYKLRDTLSKIRTQKLHSAHLYH